MKKETEYPVTLARAEAIVEKMGDAAACSAPDLARYLRELNMTKDELMGKTSYLESLSSVHRKHHPMCTGLLDYFPDALAMVSLVSWLGNEKHNPGEPVHHARGKSTDHADCVIRHMVSRDEMEVYEVGGEEIEVPHWAHAVWRALAYGQEWMEREAGCPLARGARDEPCG